MNMVYVYSLKRVLLNNETQPQLFHFVMNHKSQSPRGSSQIRLICIQFVTITSES